jgi:hypothetical protein
MENSSQSKYNRRLTYNGDNRKEDKENINPSSVSRFMEKRNSHSNDSSQIGKNKLFMLEEFFLRKKQYRRSHEKDKAMETGGILILI